ncbi:hypothetical protein GCM10025868_19240 [Angustibacter aerolatus]|uniref:GGDEF domain-containing protein n=1 Tax=Angustibacter aerolatus TaxID=1162965 RepID=A0ABQ6JHT5_9ACTN|nr:GGDEF domain-containing protein [Angustibacter aerolatus]GMA86674.1 hypothetical protein GCM10025868_19240 [Angustibacter aerolatus]
MTDVTEQRAREAGLRNAARRDGLTGLPNRSVALERLRTALDAAGQSAGQSVGVFYCDLDGFKAVNDTGGHAAGDEVLREIAQRLERCVRPTDTIARLGGDEFVAICTHVDEPAVEAIRRRLLAAVAEPVQTEAGTFTVGLSVGIAMSLPSAPLAAAEPAAPRRHRDVRPQAAALTDLAVGQRFQYRQVVPSPRRCRPGYPAGGSRRPCATVVVAAP